MRKWVWGVCLAALASLGTGLFTDFGRELASDFRCRAGELFHDPAPGTHFTILISNLAGDLDGRQTRLVRDVFLGQRGVDVRRTCHVIELATAGGSVAEAEAEALRAGQTLLDEWNADLLVWGEVKKADQELNLWFSSREGGSTLGSPSYSLTEELTLPENFQADLAAQLEAVALAQVSPATEHAGTYLVGLLKPVRDRLERMIAAPPPGLDADHMASLRFSLALAAQTIGKQSGDKEPLEAALQAYRDVLTVWTRERVPLDWARTQNNLGLALGTLGKRQSETSRLEEAVEAYRAALEERTRERMPLDWATTQNNLGLALWNLGTRENNTARLEEAVEAFRAALQEWTRERAPLDWALAQTNLGIALRMLGEREIGTARMKEAVGAFRAAIEEQSRERVPLDWARTQNNLGNALAILGERESGTPDAGRRRLEAAVEAYRGALAERTRERVPLQWAMTQNNLGNALQTLGERDSGAPDAGRGQLEAAVAAYRAALTESTRERVPLAWAGTQNNLGNALWTLGERENNLTHLQAAHDAVRGAYEVRVIEAGLTQYDGYYRARLAELEARIAALKAEPVASD